MAFDYGNEEHPITAYWLKRARDARRDDSDDMSIAYALWKAHLEGEMRAYDFAGTVIGNYSAEDAARYLRAEYDVRQRQGLS